MNDKITDSFLAAAEGAADPELRAFLAEADAAKNEIAALREELSRLRSAPVAPKSVVVLHPGAERTATQAALARLVGSARILRACLASMDRRALAPAAEAAAGLLGSVLGLTADVQALRCQVSGTEKQMRAALLSALAAEEVERGLVELQQLFLDMALVEVQGPGVDDIDRIIAAAEANAVEARRLYSEAPASQRRLCLVAGGVAALLLVALAVAVVVALALARRDRGGKLMQLAAAADLPAP